jgi:hypothetical protein
LGLFFREITPFLHGVEQIGEDYKPEHLTSNNSGLTEKSFAFQRGTIEQMYKKFTLTAILMARRPRSPRELPAKDTPISSIDDSFTRQAGHIDPNVLQCLEKERDSSSYDDTNSSSFGSVLVGKPSLRNVALEVRKTQGTSALAKRTFSYFKRKILLQD